MLSSFPYLGLLFSLLFFLVPLLFLIFGVRWVVRSILTMRRIGTLEKTGVELAGTVVESKQKQSHAGDPSFQNYITWWVETIEYRHPSGDVVRGRPVGMDYASTDRRGSVVRIVADPHHSAVFAGPEKTDLPSKSSQIKYLLMGLFMSVFSVVVLSVATSIAVALNLSI